MPPRLPPAPRLWIPNRRPYLAYADIPNLLHSFIGGARLRRERRLAPDKSMGEAAGTAATARSGNGVTA